MWRRLTGVRGLVGLRRALFAAALLSLVAMVAAILLPAGTAQQWDGPALLALAVLAVRWSQLFAVGRPSWPLDAVEAAAIALLGIAVGADNAMPVVLAGLTFRAQFASRGRVLAGAALYVAAHLVAASAAYARFPDYPLIAALAQVPLLLMVPGAAAELARGLIALEAGAAREHALAEAAASFLGALGWPALAERTGEAIDAVIGGRVAASELVLDRERVAAARRHFGTAALEFPIAGFGVLFVLPWERLRASEYRWLATLCDQLALAAVAQELRSRAATGRVERLVERTGGVALLIDSDLRVRSATPGARDLLGRRPDELEGTNVLDLLHRGDVERGREALEAGIAGEAGAPDRISVRLRAEGGQRWAELALADLRDDETVAGIVVQMRDITARIALEEDVRHRDDHDALTGLPNRERFEQMVADELRAGNDRLAVMLVDLDQFRTVNETLGHAAGDDVLATVGRHLALAVAGSGAVARLAGDDFAVLLPHFEGGAAGAESIERILQAVEQPLPALAGTLRLSASAGVVRVDAHLRSSKALLAAADAALEATHAAGSRWTMFAPKHHTQRIERALLRGELAEGIASGQLELDYQPVVDARSGAWRSCEALVRWRHPELGRLGPDRFIPLAEETDLIVSLGEWVLGEACRQLAEWRAAGVVAEDFSVAVNVSGVQAERDDVVDHVRAALTRHDLPPQRLTIEITETSMIDAAGVTERLERLRAMGVRVAIDDFGTGHSSLAYLKDLPADIVKLPRPFIRDADGSGRGTAIVHGLVGLARPLGLVVLAEGVETREQRDCVVAAGCELIQGYLYAAPMRPEQFVALAASGAEAGEQGGVGVGDHLGDPGERIPRALELTTPRSAL